MGSQSADTFPQVLSDPSQEYFFEHHTLQGVSPIELEIKEGNTNLVIEIGRSWKMVETAAKSATREPNTTYTSIHFRSAYPFSSVSGRHGVIKVDAQGNVNAETLSERDGANIDVLPDGPLEVGGFKEITIHTFDGIALTFELSRESDRIFSFKPSVSLAEALIGKD